MGWQPSRFLTDRAEAERALQLAEQLGSVNGAAAELGTTWPSLRKAFTRHGLGMPTRNPEAVRQRAIDAAHQRTGQPVTPTLDPVSWPSTPAPASPRAVTGRAVPVGPPRRGVRHPRRQRRGRAVQRKPRPPTHQPRLGDHSAGRPHPAAGRPTHQPARAPPSRACQPPQTDPTNPTKRGWLPTPADPTGPTSRRATSGSKPVVYRHRPDLMVAGGCRRSVGTRRTPASRQRRMRSGQGRSATPLSQVPGSRLPRSPPPRRRRAWVQIMSGQRPCQPSGRRRGRTVVLALVRAGSKNLSLSPQADLSSMKVEGSSRHGRLLIAGRG